MSVRILFLLALLWPISAFSQGFAALGTAADGFAIPQPNPHFVFPQDHGAHPDYRVEWWYVTANLSGTDGTQYGLQWTLFRTAFSPGDGTGWASPQIWMGHAAVTTPTAHYVAERLARGGIGQAGVSADPFSAWIDEWALEGSFDALNMSASGPDFGYEMRLDARGPIIFHGDDGYSVKSAEGQASYYYSQPFFEISGTLMLPEGNIQVTGDAWLDREWSTQPLGAAQTGWDWFSLSFDDGEKLMGFVLRQPDTVFSSATWIAADGSVTTFADGAFQAQPMRNHTVAGHTLPVDWRVTLADRNVDVTVQAINPNAWMNTSVPYWEGPVTVTGSHQGRGYLEMTGYE